MADCQFLMTNRARMTMNRKWSSGQGVEGSSEGPERRPVELMNRRGQAGSRRRPRQARTEAATGVRHGKDANLVAERR